MPSRVRISLATAETVRLKLFWEGPGCCSEETKGFIGGRKLFEGLNFLFATDMPAVEGLFYSLSVNDL